MIRDGQAHCDECGGQVGAGKGALFGGRLVCQTCGAILRQALPDPQPDWAGLRDLARCYDLAGVLIMANWVLVVLSVVAAAVVFLVTRKWLTLLGLLSVVGPLQMIVLLFTAQHLLSEFRTRDLRAVAR